MALIVPMISGKDRLKLKPSYKILEKILLS